MDANDRATLETAAVWVGMVVFGVPALALVFGVSIRLFRLVAGW
jgi:hypothetical protein